MKTGRNVWDVAAEAWVHFVRTGKDFSRDDVVNPITFRLIGNIKGKEVLDLACGEGYNTRILAEKGARVTGIDSSRRLISYAKACEREKPLGNRYFLKNANNLIGFKECTFDLVTCFMGLHDIEDYEAAVAEVGRVLKPNGRFIFSIPHPCFEEVTMKSVKRNAADNYFERVLHIVEWKMERLSKQFETVSFHRTLTDYSRMLTTNRLLIRRIIEPRPTPKAMRKYPRLKNHSKRPWSIVFETLKLP